MGVVGTDIVALLVLVIQEGPGLEEKLGYPHVLGQTLTNHVPCVIKFRNPPVQALGERAHETLFQR